MSFDDITSCPGFARQRNREQSKHAQVAARRQTTFGADATTPFRMFGFKGENVPDR